MRAKVTSVDEFLASLDPPQRGQVSALRRLILETAPGLVEHIKWNSPSYVHDGVDRLTMRVRHGAHPVQLILHMDTARAEDRQGRPVMPDDGGLVRWVSDIRGVVTIESSMLTGSGTDLSRVIGRRLRTR
ncbi:DUF1801 domain-containing protein [uncultured Microbacterium sp.]|uniref:YdhG-like domain-containing protein n=1 Tax=uncultured Microbacterium sp. TaxID=191216 RepID=A0A1Y5P2V1_9MICO|nr:DUF1801 domain-containing protein [uncultured Microbacterium sp.]SBS73046.1 hypothetical protein MIPYR_30373 [uncultured Microbacterium sp.]